MAWMNYHHLYYFWTIAKEGGVTKACHTLRLSQPTLSSQLKQFEQFMGKPLFERKSRKLVLNDSGKVVFEAAEKIFKTGEALLGTLHQDQSTVWTTLKVGVVGTLPRKDVFDFLQLPIAKPYVRLEILSDSFEELLPKLLEKEIDMVLSHRKAPPEMKSLFNYSLDQSSFVFVAKNDLKNLRRRFPKSIEGLPLFLPTHHRYIRSGIESFLKRHEIAATIKGEVQDSELLRLIAVSGEGVSVVERSAVNDLIKSKELVVLGELGELTEEYFLISFARENLPRVVKDILKKFK